jgi:RecA/RadA recombinase
MSGGEIERGVLGALLLRPELLGASDITANDFPAGRLRETFEIISALYEDKQPREIDPVILIGRLGGDGTATFVGELLNGIVRLEPEAFLSRVAEMKRSRLRRRILSALNKELKTEEKTGTIDVAGFERIRGELADYENLNRTAGVSLKPLSAVEPKTISALWADRILLAMLNLVAGPPGGGKSVLALAVAAKGSIAAPLPDSGGAVLEFDSLFLCAEDPIAQAVRPRAEANGADLSRIFFIEAEDLDAGEMFGRLRQALAANPRIKFVVVDPLNAFLKAGTDYFRDPDVRRALLRPLAGLAEETGVAVLGICHLNKRTDESGALNRIGGSVAYGAAARSVLALGFDPDNRERRLLAPAKCNYSKMPGTVAFTIGDGGRVEFEPNVIDIGADEILQRRDPEQAAEGDFAAEWLIGQLQGGPVDLKDLLQAAKKESIGRTTIFRVRKKVGVITRATGFGQFKASTWELPR